LLILKYAMHKDSNFLVAVDGTDVLLLPVCQEVDEETTTCTYSNVTDRTVYLWHWSGFRVVWENHCLIKPVGAEETIVLHYADTFIMRATFDANPLSPSIEESFVGDIPRHVILRGRSFAATKTRASQCLLN
jgi:hypothetical protein